MSINNNYNYHRNLIAAALLSASTTTSSSSLPSPSSTSLPSIASATIGSISPAPTPGGIESSSSSPSFLDLESLARENELLKLSNQSLIQGKRLLELFIESLTRQNQELAQEKGACIAKISLLERQISALSEENAELQLISTKTPENTASSSSSLPEEEDDDKTSTEEEEESLPPLPDPVSCSSHASSYGPVKRSSKPSKKSAALPIARYVSPENLFLILQFQNAPIFHDNPRRAVYSLSSCKDKLHTCQVIIKENDPLQVYLVFEKSLQGYLIFQDVKKASSFVWGTFVDFLENQFQPTTVENQGIKQELSLRVCPESAFDLFPVTKELFQEYFRLHRIVLKDLNRDLSYRLSRYSGVALQGLNKKVRESTHIAYCVPK